MATEITLSSVLLHICAYLTFPSGSTLTDVPVVHTDLGAVAGRKLTVSGEQVDAFYGIPYAEPPVGNLRFQKSLPAKPWKEVLSATKKPKPCWQFDFPFGVNITLHYENTSIASEDCLYLNIWRPSSACPSTGTCIANLPVVVFFYGGAFQWGDSALFLYDPANFVALSNVVYVTLNYRLGILGFLSSGTETLPGNYGLWDQNLALKWVKRNVGRFGGNPNDVTLNGFSAGAISAGLQAISPHSRGLFHKLILQSSTPLSMILGISLAGVGKFLGVAGNLGCFDGDPDWSENIQKIMKCLEKSNVDYIYNTLRKAGGVNKEACKSNVNVTECGAQEKDELDMFLGAQERLTKAEPRHCTAASKIIGPLLEYFLEEPRLNNHEDILRYWEIHKVERRELHQLAKCCSGIASYASKRRANLLRCQVYAFTASSQLESVDDRQHHVTPREQKGAISMYNAMKRHNM
ncbi:cholinesterase [Ixodes scapularis]|uniref:cholinesterase n=1 Tax=Ixodes scapularis TaxID=6945 RepID=UPI001C391B36|nr:cholinesterase [Ixodes scapularis]